MDSLNYLVKDPGAVRYGNFINYYTFHSPDKRLELLPLDHFNKNETLLALDIGCNAGDLTIALHKLLEDKGYDCHIVGIDIDPTLILRANEQNKSKKVSFECIDFMDDDKRATIVNKYLDRFGAKKFGVTFCFSVTMWIHLNNGDEGLRSFLNRVCDVSEMIVVEPQPWSCYKTAVRRLKRAAKHEFPLFNEIKIKEDVEFVIEGIILQENFTKVCESERTKWRRKLCIFKALDVQS